MDYLRVGISTCSKTRSRCTLLSCINTSSLSNHPGVLYGPLRAGAAGGQEECRQGDCRMRPWLRWDGLRASRGPAWQSCRVLLFFTTSLLRHSSCLHHRFGIRSNSPGSRLAVPLSFFFCCKYSHSVIWTSYDERFCFVDSVFFFAISLRLLFIFFRNIFGGLFGDLFGDLFGGPNVLPSHRDWFLHLKMMNFAFKMMNFVVHPGVACQSHRVRGWRTRERSFDGRRTRSFQTQRCSRGSDMY